ncbi:hypothetical protein BD779DRAFT_1478400 [Infundibulicybe gibba]|nr:hypothetical protein BD779DRAFT_1478400 [Infundibulicybe gibba]
MDTIFSNCSVGTPGIRRKGTFIRKITHFWKTVARGSQDAEPTTKVRVELRACWDGCGACTPRRVWSPPRYDTVVAPPFGLTTSMRVLVDVAGVGCEGGNGATVDANHLSIWQERMQEPGVLRKQEKHTPGSPICRRKVLAVEEADGRLIEYIRYVLKGWRVLRAMTKRCMKPGRLHGVHITRGFMMRLDGRVDATPFRRAFHVRRGRSSSSAPEKLSQSVVDRLKDPRMKFRTVISLLSLFRQVLHIDAANQQTRSLPESNRHQKPQLRTLVSLATLLVRRHEVTAVVGSLEQAAVAYNTLNSHDQYTPQHVITTRNPPDKKDKSSKIPIPGPDDLTVAKILMYLTQVGIVRLPASDLQWVGKKTSPPNWFDRQFIIALHSKLGVRYLRGVQRSIAQPPADPDWGRLIKGLPACEAKDPDAYQFIFPNLWSLTPESKALYTRDTHREFHQILSILLLGYRDSLKRLVGLRGSEPPEPPELEEAINAVHDCLAILEPIAHSAAAINHLSVVADAGSEQEDRDSTPAAREPPPASVIAPSDEADDHEKIEMRLEEATLEDSADMDVTDVEEALPPSLIDTPLIRWLKLQVAYFTVPNNIISLFQPDAHLPNPIKLTIYPIRYTGKTMAPLMPVLEDVVRKHPLHLATADESTDMELVKEAFATMVDSEDVHPSFGHVLGRMRWGSGFNGRIHCEAALAAHLFGPAESGSSVYDKNTIGVSKRCCPVCSAILEELSPAQIIDTLGSHRTLMPCALPDTLPPEVVDRILHRFEGQLASALRDLYQQSKHPRKGSHASDGSANSHPLGGVLEKAVDVYDI